jgi:SPW repeat
MGRANLRELTGSGARHPVIRRVTPQIDHRLLIGVVLIISPFVFGYSGNGAATRFAIIFGAFELLTALGTRWQEPADVTATRLSGTGAHAAR